MTGADAIILFVMALTLGLSLGGFAARLFFRPSKAVVAARHDKIGTGVKFPAGTEITCPKCGKFVGAVKHDIFPMTRRSRDSFEFSDNAVADFGLPPIAACCGFPVWKTFDGKDYLHTKNGWAG